MLTRRMILGAASLPFCGKDGLSAPIATAIPKPLKRRIPFGSASMIQTLRADPRFGEELIKRCDIIVPMNCLKWEQLRHDRTRFDTADADNQIAFAQKHGKSVRGHALLWGLALPPWVKTITSRKEAEQELTNHIKTVVTTFKGRIPSWDVVNEVVADHPEKGSVYRPSIWQQLLGPSHIELAFKTAAAADPSARLVINDYNLEYDTETSKARRSTLLTIIKNLKNKGIPIHGVGLQAHLYAEQHIDTVGLAKFIGELNTLGMEILVTEMDVIDWRLPGDIAERDMAAAKQVSTFLETIGSVKLPSSIVTWGLTDRYSWVHDTFKRKDSLQSRPLPLDANYRPKPMWNVIENFCASKA